MKNMGKCIALLLALLMMCMPLAACSGSGSGSEDEEFAASEEAPEPTPEELEPDSAVDTDNTPEIYYQPESNGIFFEEEVEGAELKMVKSDPSKYVGTWEGTSDSAVYFYGNIDITVNSDGTWKGNITEEDTEGTWESFPDHLHMESELINFDLAFEEGGHLIMTETGSDFVLNTVLTEK